MAAIGNHAFQAIHLPDVPGNDSCNLLQVIDVWHFLELIRIEINVSKKQCLTGEQKVINSVMLKLTDGTDSFLGEITGERAVNCPKFDPLHQYKVQCSMVVREWNSQQTGEAMQATTIYVDKIGMV